MLETIVHAGLGAVAALVLALLWGLGGGAVWGLQLML